MIASYGPLVLSSWGAAALLMLFLWAIQIRTRNAGIVDAGWAAALGGLAIAYALVGNGDPLRRLLIAAMGGAWGLRLAAHLLIDRVIGVAEEGRYRTLRAAWQRRFQLKMFAYFQLQAVSVVILAVPFLLVSMNERPFPGFLDVLAIIVFATGWIGEAVADRQLRAFKADPTNRGKTCRAGLWRYSRHPNYFFEWLMWCAYGVMALGAPYGWIGLGAPLLMLFLILKVTGIPPTEAQALASRGEDYRAYQRTTSAFVPWFPKSETS
jgi:steroid 5-alpha reductase family enzyme